MPDLNKRELALLVPIAAVVLWMGVYPESFLAPMRNDVEHLLARIERAAPPSDAQPTKGQRLAVPAHTTGEEEAAGGAH